MLPLSFALFSRYFSPFSSPLCLFPLELLKLLSVALSLALQRLLHLQASGAHLLRVEPPSKPKLVLILDRSLHKLKVSLRHH